MLSLAALAVLAGCGGGLFRAAAKNDVERLAKLLDAKPELVSAKDKYGDTPLNYAARRGQLEAAKLLIQRGADVNAANHGWPPLLVAVTIRDEALVELLVASGANVNLPRAFFTPLCAAVAEGDIPLTRFLLGAGADVNPHWGLNNTGWELPIIDPLVQASSGRFEVRNSASVGRSSTPDSAGRGFCERIIITAMMHGTTLWDLHTLDRYGVREIGPPLHWASFNGHLEMVKLLIAHGADADALGRHGDPALQYAASQGHKDVAALLLDNGADVNARPGWSETALYWAADNGHRDVAELLLGRGAQVNQANKASKTPLHAAAKRGRLSVVKLLLARGAAPDAKDSSGQTPLHLARARGHEEVLRLLREAAGRTAAKGK